MNSQREVIYKRRKNALYGERLQFDIMNMLYDICEDMAHINRVVIDSDELRLQAISNLGIDFQMSADELQKISESALAEKLYDQAYAAYLSKNKVIVRQNPSLAQAIVEKQRGSRSKYYDPFYRWDQTNWCECQFTRISEFKWFSRRFRNGKNHYRSDY